MQTQLSTVNPDLASLLTGYLFESPPPTDPIDPPDNQGGGGTPAPPPPDPEAEEGA